MLIVSVFSYNFKNFIENTSIFYYDIDCNVIYPIMFFPFFSTFIGSLIINRFLFIFLSRDLVCLSKRHRQSDKLFFNLCCFTCNSVRLC